MKKWHDCLVKQEPPSLRLIDATREMLGDRRLRYAATPNGGTGRITCTALATVKYRR